MKNTITTNTPQATIEAGVSFGKSLKSGSIVALRGTLGAGKTTFSKGVALSLGILDDITSPTFCLVNEYPFPTPQPAASQPSPSKKPSASPSGVLYHIDAYRLQSADDFYNLGSDDFLYGNGICLIEWPENVAAAIPPSAIQIDFVVNEDGSRTISIDSPTPQS